MMSELTRFADEIVEHEETIQSKDDTIEEYEALLTTLAKIMHQPHLYPEFQETKSLLSVFIDHGLPIHNFLGH
jgi:hypothetical protein